MGTYQYADPVTGKQYDFNYEGDELTDVGIAFITDKIQQDRAAYTQIQEKYGFEVPEANDGTAVGRAFREGRTSGKQAIGSLLEEAGELSGLEFLSAYGERMQDRARDRAVDEAILNIGAADPVTDFREVYEDGFDLERAGQYLGQLVGGTAASAVSSLQGAGIGAGVGAGAGLVTGGLPGAVAGAGTGASVGSVAGLMPRFAGSSVEAIKENTGKDDITAKQFLLATGGSIFQALAERFGLKYLAKIGFTKEVAAKSILGRTLKGGVKSSFVEGLTEPAQQLIERIVSAQSVEQFEDGIFEELLQAMVGGVVLGGGVGGTSSAIFGKPQAETKTETKEETKTEIKQDQDKQDQTDKLPSSRGDVKDAVTPDQKEEIDKQAEKISEDLTPEIVGANTPTEQEAVSAFANEYNVSEETLDEVLKVARAVTGGNYDTVAGIADAFADAEQVSDAQRSEIIGKRKLKDATVNKEQQNKDDAEVADEQNEGAAAQNKEIKNSVTTEAKNLIKKLDATGGVIPALNNNLKRILQDNGIVVTKDTTPDAAILALRAKINATGGTDVATDPTGDGSGTGIGVQSGVETTVEDTTELETLADERVGTGEGTQPVAIAAAQPQKLTETSIEEVQRRLQQAGRNLAVGNFSRYTQENPEVGVFHDTYVEQNRDRFGEEDFFLGHDLEKVNALSSRKATEQDKETEVRPEDVMTPEQQAASTFFERFRRPEDALATIAYTNVLDDVAKKEMFLDPAAQRSASFTEPFTQTAAKDAESWVRANLRPQTIELYDATKAQAEKDNQAAIQKRGVKVVELQTVEPKPKKREDPDGFREWERKYKDTHKINGQPKKRIFEKTRDDVAMSARIAAEAKDIEDASKDVERKAEAKRIREEQKAKGPTLPKMPTLTSVAETFEETVDKQKNLNIQNARAAKRKKENIFEQIVQRELGLSPDAAAGLTQDQRKYIRKTILDELYPEIVSKNMAAQVGLGNADLLPSTLTQLTAKDKKLVAEAAQNVVASKFDPEQRAVMEELITKLQPKAKLYTEFVVDLNVPVDANTMTMLEDNNLADALKEYAKSATDSGAAIARMFAKRVGNTKVVMQALDPDVAGFFDPRENTIVFNSNVPITGHTLLHEMAHAVTIAELRNKSSVTTKQITKIYDTVKDILPTAYGTQNVDEFVAEVYGNPEFRTMLAQIQDKGQYNTPLRRIAQAIARFFRRIGFELGFPPPQRRTFLDTLDTLVDRLVSPAPNFIDADPLYMVGHNPDSAAAVGNMSVLSQPTPTPERGEKFNEFIQSGVGDNIQIGTQSAATVLMNLTPLHTLANFGEKYFPQTAQKMNALMNKAGGELQIMYDKVNAVTEGVARWAKTSKGKKLVPLFNAIINTSTAYQVDPELSLKEAKEIYSQDIIEKIYKPLKKDFERLGEDGRRLFRETRNMFRGLRSDLEKSIEIRMKASNVPDDVRKKIMDSFYAKVTQRGVIEPYFPLDRAGGDFWLTFSGIDPLTGNVEYFSERFNSARARDRAEKKLLPLLIKEMQESEIGKQRIASFNGDIAAAIGMEKKTKMQLADFEKAPPQTFINELMQALNARGSEINKETKEQIGNLILDAVPETSYLQSFRKRKGGDLMKARAGFDQDAIRVISDRSKSLTRQITNMKYTTLLRANLVDMQKEFNEGDQSAAAATYLKQFAKYAQNGPMPERSKLSRLGTAVGFNFTLGANISGGIVNLSQIPLVTLPYLSGKYGIGPTVRYIGEASKIFKNSGFERKVMSYGDKVDAQGNPVLEEKSIKAPLSISNYNFNDPNLDPDIAILRALVEVGSEFGQFKRSLDYEILDLDNMTSMAAKFNRASGFMQHHGERINREVALVAAYKGALNAMSPEARNNPEKQREAAIEAIKDVETTNGGIAAGAAPQLATGSLGAVVFMYKRYGVTMIGMLVETFKKLFTGSMADRRMAAFQLAGIYGASSLLAGVHGMPGFGLITTAIDTSMAIMGFDPGGEDDDAKTAVRAYLGEGPYKGAINYYAGVNVASRIGLSELLFRDQIIQKEQPFLWDLAEQLGGPLVGIWLNGERGYKLLREGELYRGAEAMAPAAIKNAMKSLRYSEWGEGGINTIDGKPIVSDISAGHILAQAMGFTPAEYSAQMTTNARAMGLQKGISDARKRLFDRFARATFERDAEAREEVLADIREYNQRYPQYPILADNLIKSIRGRTRRREEAFFGMTINPKLRNTVLENAGRYGDPVYTLG